MLIPFLTWIEGQEKVLEKEKIFTQEIVFTEKPNVREPKLVVYHYHPRVAFGSINVWENGDILVEVFDYQAKEQYLLCEWLTLTKESDLEELLAPYFDTLKQKEHV